MAVDAIVQEGKILETASENSVKKANGNNGMDKDAFLQLLVAQMKYQDPLEPTSNTEYISQYATFSQVEQLQNMSATMELTRASSMVGKLVEVETTDADGEAKSVQGMVEYVSYENGKAFVSIDGSLYSLEDVKAVVDENYQNAYDLAVSFASAMNKLPPLTNLTAGDKEAVDALQSGFNNMTDYQQSFIANKYIEMLQKYVERMAALTADSEEDGKTEGTEGTEGSEGSEGVDAAESVDKAEDAAGAADADKEETEGSGQTEESGGTAGESV